MTQILYKLTVTILFLLFTLFGGVSAVFADNTPPGFTTCLNPQGALIAPTTQGMHGIAGNTARSGIDTVYKVTDIAVTQCFCADNGQGIQTNWWKIANMGQATITSFQNQGWIYIPAGDLWGLDNAPYLAQNSSFSCAIVEGDTGKQPSNSQPSSNTSSGSNSTTSTSNNNSSSTPSGSPSLANTGDIVFVYSIFLLGFLFLGSALFLSFRNKK